ncbi:hypothetical protein ACFQ1S_41265, partial [Kibdelosporangium lantanae]
MPTRRTATAVDVQPADPAKARDVTAVEQTTFLKPHGWSVSPVLRLPTVRESKPIVVPDGVSAGRRLSQLV